MFFCWSMKPILFYLKHNNSSVLIIFVFKFKNKNINEQEQAGKVCGHGKLSARI